MPPGRERGTEPLGVDHLSGHLPSEQPALEQVFLAATAGLPYPGRAADAGPVAIHVTYERSGSGAGMAHFIAVVSHRGRISAEFASQVSWSATSERTLEASGFLGCA